MTLGEIIREYTNKHSMTKFLKDSGLSKAYAYMLINNRNNSGAPIVPSIETIKKVAAGTHQSFNEIFALLDPDMDVSTRDDREDTSMKLSKNIRYLRKQRGMSQEQLADLLGYKSYTTIQKWESGISDPPITVLQQIAEIFHVDITDLTEKDLENTEVQFLGHQPEYYYDEDARELAEFLYNNPAYKTLFDASRKVKPEDLEFVRQMIERMGGSD